MDRLAVFRVALLFVALVGVVASTNGTHHPRTNVSCPLMADGTCYLTLAEAVTKGRRITVVENIIIREEVVVNNSIRIDGGGRIVAAYLRAQDKAGTILRGAASGILVEIYNTNFVNLLGWASVFRSPELGTGEQPVNPTVGPVNLWMKNCSANGFGTASRGGAVIALGWVDNVVIENSTFLNNLVDPDADEHIRPQWTGAGAIWIYNAFGTVQITDCVFKRNSNIYGHGYAGAIGIHYMDGVANISGNFEENVANSGGAIVISTTHTGAVVRISGTFGGNVAQDNGWDKGARGGAVWLQFIKGYVDIRGFYYNNRCTDGRGGAFANNRIYTNGWVQFSGIYTGNTALRGASVWDTLYEKSGVFNNFATITDSNPDPHILLRTNTTARSGDNEDHWLTE